MSAEKGGALRTQTTGGRRALLALLFSAGLIVAPLVLLHGSASAAHGAEPAGGGRSTSAGSRTGTAGAGSVLAGYRVSPSPNHRRSVRPATVPTTTTVPPTTTTTPPPPTTTVPPTTTTTLPPAPLDDSSEEGVATWYSEAPPGGCASPSLAFGTEVQVTDSSAGTSTTCVVDDREAPNPGRVVDLSYSGFSQLADPSQGVATVTVSW
ncbi:MAG TPA: septal ring lytic transglycosylase RlpA family protein [Acidimicrobiales bacterium]|nr:septal ring lytic transglycosylase RlpA family protein [Acidimicrobiales bacterium]